MPPLQRTNSIVIGAMAAIVVASQVPSLRAVILLDPPTLADAVWQQLEDYARGGGGVAMFLGPAAHPATFNTEIPQTVLAGKLGVQARYPAGDLYLRPDPDAPPPRITGAFMRSPRRLDVVWDL